MPVREKDRRDQRREEIQVQLSTWDKELLDQEWLERLAVNQDWRRLVALYRQASRDAETNLKLLKEELCSQPMLAPQADLLRQKIMLLERDMANRESFFGFPNREVERLKRIRSEYPMVQAELKQLERGEETDG